MLKKETDKTEANKACRSMLITKLKHLPLYLEICDWNQLCEYDLKATTTTVRRTINSM